MKSNQHVKTMMVIELFTTKECPKCVKVKKFLGAQGIKYAERVIDGDCEAETDALMLNIFAAPALKIGDLVFKSKDIFNDGELSEKIKGLLIEMKGID